MQTEINKRNQLIAFRQKGRFSNSIWENRGLIAPNIDSCKEMELIFNQVVDKLIEMVDHAPTPKQLKLIVKDGLKLFSKNDFDTEEKELIADLFFELSNIVGVNITSDINKWLYGALMNTLIKLSKLKSETIIEIRKQPCINCGVELESHIMAKEEGIPDISWSIVRCNNCKEVTILSHGPGIKHVKESNYEWLGSLSKEEYNYEQALIRVKQIKFEKHRFHY